MPLPLATSPFAQSVSSDPLDHLVECHARIRHFLGVASKIAASPGAPPKQIGEAAAAVSRYFSEAFPRHRDDEDLSMKPLLLVADRNGEVSELLATMTSDHGEIDLRIDLLVALVRPLASDAGPVGEVASSIRDAVAAADELLRPHLAMEETTLFPAARRLLGAEARDALLAEMRKRRRPSGQPR